ncbi:hypothetical protein ILYODFUR_031310 [Ilyodon furcidens]|uniref:Leucine-rich repeat protein SHOC-2 n=1 Tax=Ilyodon furcidens TaxID=33524 RepID=A0ABV0UB83_9TELE
MCDTGLLRGTPSDRVWGFPSRPDRIPLKEGLKSFAFLAHRQVGEPSLKSFHMEHTQGNNHLRSRHHLHVVSRKCVSVPQNVYRLNIDEPVEAQENVSFGGSDRWWEQTDLTKLLLSSNKLTQLSEDIKLLPTLTTLDLHDNQLSSLPSALGELQELQQLRLSHNKLSSLPTEVCALRNLRSLTLQQNLLENVPEEIGQLGTLTELVTATYS